MRDGWNRGSQLSYSASGMPPCFKRATSTGKHELNTKTLRKISRPSQHIISSSHIESSYSAELFQTMFGKLYIPTLFLHYVSFLTSKLFAHVSNLFPHTHARMHAHTRYWWPYVHASVPITFSLKHCDVDSFSFPRELYVTHHHCKSLQSTQTFQRSTDTLEHSYISMQPKLYLFRFFSSDVLEFD